ncbi:MAG: bifunctional phosphopantothenoylcysteine decarboxylase/phosphopantothenate--cysteine ligase CoaBC [Lachnospiraceae bacterium]|nr:bifunctional phosphopantothenoylcysteine decarboxylase/phosphopantothenate--cysteine ligase CoaBC [Lachnospiraceae bacterium]MDD7328084.1 bifunctional phosphopantothenoylcysteine decarboxylase/phosphopantothenate--cysteine ligase CoaBC [Lachnospiraceae bacterium]MDY2759486.1 bifunctional phosphopantothenoylcysteine decarboxylase/phosphopantothenate--cysteine ligase CoaBC [Lachnospiraceae bacterium]
MLKDKCIVIGVTGSIAAYKAADVVSFLKKQGADVTVIMTKNALNFINPITFETLSGNKCLIDTFDRNFEFSVEHVSLAKRADLFVVAPASADFIAKAANGIADDMLTTTFLASTCKKLIFPAMNTRMYENPITQDNMKKLEHYGIEIVEPASGYLACGDTGRGKLAPVEEIEEYIMMNAAYDHDLAGKRVLVSAGPTQEDIDPVRFITNHSTGKMGYAVARNAARRGADVTLVSGPVSLDPPLGVRVIQAKSAQQMFDEITDRSEEQDIIIMTAAVADMRPLNAASEKIHKVTMPDSIKLGTNPDILSYLGAHRRDGQVIVGFSMETENLIENSRVKLAKKHCDMIVANSLREKGAGFGTDTNVVTLITKDKAEELPIMSKDEVAERIFTFIRDM